jgi:hypothetical protein
MEVNCLPLLSNRTRKRELRKSIRVSVSVSVRVGVGVIIDLVVATWKPANRRSEGRKQEMALSVENVGDGRVEDIQSRSGAQRCFALIENVEIFFLDLPAHSVSSTLDCGCKREHILDT